MIIPTATLTVTPEHHQQVLDLLEQQGSATQEEVRKALKIGMNFAITLLEDMLGRNLIKPVVRPQRSTLYAKATFNHDPKLVNPTWVRTFKKHFQPGVSATAISVAQQFGLDLESTRATLEEMRKQGTLHGRYVGASVIYSAQSRMVQKQARPEDLERIKNHNPLQHPEAKRTTTTPGTRKPRVTNVSKVVQHLLKTRKNKCPELGDEYLQVVEAADALGVSHINLGRWAARKGYTVRHGTYAWISASDLLNYAPRTSADFLPIEVGA